MNLELEILKRVEKKVDSLDCKFDEFKIHIEQTYVTKGEYRWTMGIMVTVALAILAVMGL